MSFLAPLFLAGAFVIGLPILFHLIRRSTREKTVFSSLMFLNPSPPRVSRKSKLEHLLLLLLRCAAVVLLALGFARPFLKHVFPLSQAAGPARRMLVLLDTSASMRRQNLWSAAQEKAETVARQASPGDEVAFFTFDRQLKPVVGFEEWKATPAGDRLGLVRNRLAGLEPGWAGTRLDSALIRAAEMVVEGEDAEFAGSRQVVLISDLQEGSQIRALQGHEWPKGLEVRVETVPARTKSNASVQLVSGSDEKAYGADSTVRVRVSNAADSKREQFQVSWAAAGTDGPVAGAKPVGVYVPPGQSRTVTLPVPGTNVACDHVVLKGDDDPFDNTAFVLPPQRTRTTVMYFGDEPATDDRQPLFFLTRAFQETPRQQVQVIAHRSSTPLTGDEIQNATLLIVTGQLSDTEVRALRDAVEQGKTLLFAPASVEAVSSLSSLFGTQVAFSEKSLGEPPTHQPPDPSIHQSINPPAQPYAMLSQIDFRSPLFTPFADPRFSDFSKLHFWRYRTVNVDTLPKARVLAQFDTGDPAMVEIPLGRGRVVLWSFCWQPADSQLSVSSKFVPLLYSLLEYSGARPPAPQQYFVGESVPLEARLAEGPSSAQMPDGSVQPLRSGETNFSETLTPGIYSMRNGASTMRFAINLEPSESRTAPMPVDELEQLGVPTGHSAPVALNEADRKIRLQNSELEARQKLWRWFILATVGLLLMETWLAGRTGRHSVMREAST